MSLLLALPAALAVALVSPRSQACSPPLTMLEGTVPTSGGTHPANAPVLFKGYSLQLDALEATIDGQPATTKKVLTMASAVGYDQQTIALDPPPKPGQQVTLKGKVCKNFGAEDKCTVDLSFTASAEDLAAPPPINAVEFDVHDHPDMNIFVGSCTSATDLAYFVRLKAATDSETPSYWIVDGYDIATGKALLFSTVRPRQDKLVLRLTNDSLQGNPVPSGICIEVTGVDLAGNKTAPVRACDPCRFRKETGDPSMEGLPPQEPAWTEADIVPGGACDPGGGQGGFGGSGQAGSGGSGQSGAAGSGQSGAGGAGQGGAGGSGGSGQGGTGGSGQAGSGGSGQSGAGQGGAGGSGGSGQGGAESGGSGPSTEGVSSEESGGCAVASGRGGAGGAALGLVAALGTAMARRRRR